jgi:hypothetical protein
MHGKLGNHEKELKVFPKRVLLKTKLETLFS